MTCGTTRSYWWWWYKSDTSWWQIAVVSLAFFVWHQDNSLKIKKKLFSWLSRVSPTFVVICATCSVSLCACVDCLLHTCWKIDDVLIICRSFVCLHVFTNVAVSRTLSLPLCVWIYFQLPSSKILLITFKDILFQYLIEPLGQSSKDKLLTSRGKVLLVEQAAQAASGKEFSISMNPWLLSNLRCWLFPTDHKSSLDEACLGRSCQETDDCLMMA